MRKSAIVLCYHKVGPFAEEGRRLNVEPERLSQHVAFFSRRRRVALARDFGEEFPVGSVCFTFDDAYLSTMGRAPEILERHRARGTFYAVSAKVGQSSGWDGEAARPLADWASLLEAQKRGHEIGNHTATHPHLDQLSPERQREEVETCDRRLRRQGILPGSFCYPYGGLNASAKEAVRSAGYRVGMALGKRPATEEEDRLEISRVVVAFGDALPLLLYRIHLRPRLRRR